MALTDIKVRTTKPSDKPFKLTDGQGMHLLINPNDLLPENSARVKIRSSLIQYCTDFGPGSKPRKSQKVRGTKTGMLTINLKPLHVKVAFYFPEIISLNTLASGKNDKAY